MTCKYGIKNTPPVEAISISAYGCLVQNGVILHQDLKLIDLLGKSLYIALLEIQDYEKFCTFFVNFMITKSLLELQQIEKFNKL